MALLRSALPLERPEDHHPSIDMESFHPVVNGDADLLCCPRRVPAETTEALRLWALEHRSEFDEILRPTSRWSHKALHGLVGPARGWVFEDLEALIEGFRRLTDAKRIRLFFGVVRDDKCRKFHIDCLRYRLITTYVGPGTQWLPKGETCETALLDESRIQRAVAGDVVLMKGNLVGGGLPHRSPPIQGSGAVRVVAVINTVEPRYPWEWH